MRTGVTISAIGHVAVLVWASVTLTAVPLKSDTPTPLVVDIQSDSDISKLTPGIATAPKTPTPRHVAEKIGAPKPVEDPTAKVVDGREVTATTEAPPPVPPPRPKARAAKAPAEPTRDLIAEAIKKDEAKKPEPRVAARIPTPPRRPPQRHQRKFDPKKVAALLDKRVSQRRAATGETLNNQVSLGAPSAIAARLSQSELDALRARLAQLWNPPVGARNPDELVVQVRMQLKPDGTLAAPPLVLTSGHSPLFMAARDSAVRAVFRGQPFDMLRPEHYDQWKDVEITFDPRDMIKG
jgi:hypothetical protein